MTLSQAESEQTPETTPEAPAVLAEATFYKDSGSPWKWLDFGGWAGDDVHAIMKAAGWRWSGKRDQYRCNARFPTFPPEIKIVEGGTVEYSAERPDRLEASAARHTDLSNAAYQRSNAAVAMIPLGQPILVGHHSERGHRAALKRSRRAMDTSVSEAAYAKDLQHRAESSRRHQARKDDPNAMQRRADRLSADLRKMQREPWTGKYAAEWQRRVDLLTAEIADLQQRITEAGGTTAERLAAQGIVAGAGDLVKIHGFVGTVARVNPKTYSVVLRDGWPLKLDKTHLQAIIATAAEIAANKAAQAERANA